MNPNPIHSLLHSRKFIIFSITTTASLITYFSTKYLAPSQATDVAVVLGAVMAFAGWYMKLMKDEDVARLENPSVVETTTSGVNPRTTVVESKEEVSPVSSLQEKQWPTTNH